MRKNKRIMWQTTQVGSDHIQKEDIGYLFWKLEHITDFIPCYQHIIESIPKEKIEHSTMKKEG